MNYLVTEIFAKQALGHVFTGDYVDWAVEMLVQGHDSRSLRILAGLDRSGSTFEAENYFVRSMSELDLTPPDPDSAIRAYACEIARRIIDSEITSHEGVRALYKICTATYYAPDFVIWLQLDDALDSLIYGHHPFTYESATLDNFDAIVKREAADFIAAVCPEQTLH